MAHSDRLYVPAAGRDWLLPLYDPLQWLLGGDRVRAEMIEAAALRPGMRALDVGCGTGSLVLELARSHPEVEATGLDPDPKALGRARRKLAREGLTAQMPRLDEGSADALPYADGAFERVFSSFMLHHLARPTKEAMLREVRRVLAPAGALHLADFGGEGSGHDSGLLARLVHSQEELAESFGGAIPSLMQAAGLESAREVSTRRTLFGRVTHYEARRPL